MLAILVLVGLVAVALATSNDDVNTGNEVSSRGVEMNDAFLAWSEEWNRREYGTRSASEYLLWEKYLRAHKRFEKAHKRWERGY